MEDKKFCGQCGTENNKDSKFCEACGNNLEQDTNIENKVVPETNKATEDVKKGDFLGYMSIAFFFFGGLITRLFGFIFTISNNNKYLSSLSGILVLSSIVLMIYGRIKYPKNKVLKIAMILMIVAIILAIVYFVFIAMLAFFFCGSCLETLRDMD